MTYRFGRITSHYLEPLGKRTARDHAALVPLNPPARLDWLAQLKEITK